MDLIRYIYNFSHGFWKYYNVFLLKFCRKVWEHYLKVCKENNSLFGMEWAQLKSQLNSAEMTKTYVLNPLAPEFVPSRMYHITHNHPGTHIPHHGPPWIVRGHRGPFTGAPFHQVTIQYYQTDYVEFVYPKMHLSFVCSKWCVFRKWKYNY